MNFLRQKNQSVFPNFLLLILSPDFLLLLLLLFWIPMENTLLGRAYTHVLGLNEFIAQSASTPADRGLVWAQSALLFTIVTPFLIALVSRPAVSGGWTRLLIRVGLIVWVIGAALSALAHHDIATVILNFTAGILSAAAVFFAIRRVQMDTQRHYELAFCAMAVGSLIPCIIDLYRYHSHWGIPSIPQMIAIKYHPDYWAQFCFFGNPDNASCAYGLFAMLCMPVACGKVFSNTTRFLAWLTLVVATLNTLLTMARTGIIFLLATLFLTAILLRNRVLLITIAAAALLLIGLSSASSFSNLLNYFSPAFSYDRQDTNNASRIESMQEGWEVFRENPVVGIGPGQSKTVIDETVPHEMLSWQAAEDGIFGLIGVILVAVGCLSELAFLARRGRRSVRARTELVFLLAPAMYFARGLVSDTTMNNSVVNTWICMVFAALGLVETIPVLETAVDLMTAEASPSALVS